MEHISFSLSVSLAFSALLSLDFDSQSAAACTLIALKRGGTQKNERETIRQTHYLNGLAASTSIVVVVVVVVVVGASSSRSWTTNSSSSMAAMILLNVFSLERKESERGEHSNWLLDSRERKRKRALVRKESERRVKTFEAFERTEKPQCHKTLFFLHCCFDFARHGSLSTRLLLSFSARFPSARVLIRPRSPSSLSLRKGAKRKPSRREREREGERESLITRSFLSSSLPSFRAPSFFRVCRLLSVRRDKRRESSAQSKNGGRAPSSPAGVQARRHGHRRQRFGRDDDASRCRGLRRRERGRPLHAPEDPAAPA